MDPPCEAIDDPTDYVCTVCRDVWVKPVTVKPCDHIFCRHCVANFSKCPDCRQPITGFAKPHQILVRQSEAIRVRCADCAAEMTRKDSYSHSCPPKQVAPEGQGEAPTPVLRRAEARSATEATQAGSPSAVAAASPTAAGAAPAAAVAPFLTTYDFQAFVQNDTSGYLNSFELLKSIRDALPDSQHDGVNWDDESQDNVRKSLLALQAKHIAGAPAAGVCVECQREDSVRVCTVAVDQSKRCLTCPTSHILRKDVKAFQQQTVLDPRALPAVLSSPVLVQGAEARGYRCQLRVELTMSQCGTTWRNETDKDSIFVCFEGCGHTACARCIGLHLGRLQAMNQLRRDDKNDNRLFEPTDHFRIHPHFETPSLAIRCPVCIAIAAPLIGSGYVELSYVALARDASNLIDMSKAVMENQRNPCCPNCLQAVPEGQLCRRCEVGATSQPGARVQLLPCGHCGLPSEADLNHCRRCDASLCETCRMPHGRCVHSIVADLPSIRPAVVSQVLRRFLVLGARTRCADCKRSVCIHGDCKIVRAATCFTCQKDVCAVCGHADWLKCGHAEQLAMFAKEMILTGVARLDPDEHPISLPDSQFDHNVNRFVSVVRAAMFTCAFIEHVDVAMEATLLRNNESLRADLVDVRKFASAGKFPLYDAVMAASLSGRVTQPAPEVTRDAVFKALGLAQTPTDLANSATLWWGFFKHLTGVYNPAGHANDHDSTIRVIEILTSSALQGAFSSVLDEAREHLTHNTNW
jgi:hypothetical protein